MIWYRLVLTLAWPVLAVAFLTRVLRGQESLQDFGQRLRAERRRTYDLWVHGASNGELASAKPVVVKIIARHPTAQVLVTANTRTGRALVKGWEIPQVTPALAPLDTRWAAPRAKAHLTLEAELWPNRIRAIPTAVLGARMSAKTQKGWRRFSKVADAVFARITCVIPQDDASAQRFRELGVSASRVTASLQLKALYTAPDRPIPDDIAATFVRDETWLAASTHEGEEDVVIQAYLMALKTQPALKLILAPRHPVRAQDVLRLIQAHGLTAHQRSKGPTPKDTTILLADTMGEMAIWYASAFATFIGGTINPRGGHTPFEPAAHNSAIIHGPDTSNFADSFAALYPDGALAITDAEGLAKALISLANPENRAVQITAAHKALRKSDTAQVVIDALETALPLNNDT